MYYISTHCPFLKVITFNFLFIKKMSASLPENLQNYPFLQENVRKDMIFKMIGLPANNVACYKAAVELDTYLRNVNSKNSIILEFSVVKSSCFHILLQTEQKLSIAVPSDANQYCSGKPDIFEIALMSGNELIYNPELGYDDVCRFTTHEEVFDELVRINTHTQMK